MSEKLEAAKKLFDNAIEEELKNARAELENANDSLKKATQKTTELEQTLEALTATEAAAESKAQAAVEDAKRLSELASNNYASAVKSLFEGPKHEMLSEIKKNVSNLDNITSRKLADLNSDQRKSTAVWTVVSLIFGGLISALTSYWFQLQADKETVAIQKELRELRNSMVKSEIMFTDLRQAEVFTEAIYRRLSTLGKSNLNKRQIVELVYKLEIPFYPRVTTTQVLKAFREIGLQVTEFNGNAEIIQRWDDELIVLYTNAYEELKKHKPDEKVGLLRRDLSLYKGATDQCPYGDIGFDANMTMDEAREFTQNLKKAVEMKSKRN